ncbi:Rhomboid-related protein 3 [Folsomia candida]|uniref:Rhomboid-related protein 3 n=1 Tax=Folsomia candida TaxID=158441 RepID=A0A226ECE5_FOLCA|nr:Rhomboid-related protein 3 [Folsomia candida]
MRWILDHGEGASHSNGGNDPVSRWKACMLRLRLPPRSENPDKFVDMEKQEVSENGKFTQNPTQNSENGNFAENSGNETAKCFQPNGNCTSIQAVSESVLRVAQEVSQIRTEVKKVREKVDAVGGLIGTAYYDAAQNSEVIQNVQNSEEIQNVQNSLRRKIPNLQNISETSLQSCDILISDSAEPQNCANFFANVGPKNKTCKNITFKNPAEVRTEDEADSIRSRTSSSSGSSLDLDPDDRDLDSGLDLGGRHSRRPSDLVEIVTIEDDKNFGENANYFVVEDRWRKLFDKYDPEGFGEIPWPDFLATLENCESDFWREIPPGKRQLLRDLGLIYSQDTSAITFQCFVNIVSAKKNYEFYTKF